MLNIIKSNELVGCIALNIDVAAWEIKIPVFIETYLKNSQQIATLLIGAVSKKCLCEIFTQQTG